MICIFKPCHNDDQKKKIVEKIYVFDRIREIMNSLGKEKGGGLC